MLTSLSKVRWAASTMFLAAGLSACGGRNLEALIYVLHDGETTRVGQATAASTVNFSLPRRILGESRLIRLIAHAVGSGQSVRTDPLSIHRGEVIEWRLESQLSRSSVSVY